MKIFFQSSPTPSSTIWFAQSNQSHLHLTTLRVNRPLKFPFRRSRSAVDVRLDKRVTLDPSGRRVVPGKHRRSISVQTSRFLREAERAGHQTDLHTQAHTFRALRLFFRNSATTVLSFSFSSSLFFFLLFFTSVLFLRRALPSRTLSEAAISKAATVSDGDGNSG